MAELTQLIINGTVQLAEVVAMAEDAKLILDSVNALKKVIKFPILTERYVCYVNEGWPKDEWAGIYIYVSHDGNIEYQYAEYGTKMESYVLRFDAQSMWLYALSRDYTKTTKYIDKSSSDELKEKLREFLNIICERAKKRKILVGEKIIDLKRMGLQEFPATDKKQFIQKELEQCDDVDTEIRELVINGLQECYHKKWLFGFNEMEIPCKIGSRQWATIAHDGILKVPTKNGEVFINTHNCKEVYDAIFNPEFGTDLRYYLEMQI